MADHRACGVPGSSVADVSYEKACEEFGNQKFWISFFIRPCCPAPSGKTAKVQLENQREMVRAREDFTDEQKAHLIGLIDQGEAWYRTTPYWGAED